MQKNNNRFKKLKERKKGKLHIIAKAQCRDRFITKIKNVTEGKKKPQKLNWISQCPKIDNYKRRGRKKNPNDSTEQVKKLE